MRPPVQRTGVLVALGLAAVCLPAHRAAADVDPALKPTLLVFVNVPTPMPNFDSPLLVYYAGLPDGHGRTRGSGAGDLLRGWYSQMKGRAPAFLEQNKRLEKTGFAFGKSVRTLSDKVLALMGPNLKAQLDQFDAATENNIPQYLRTYRDEVGAAARARALHASAKKAALAARYDLDASDQDVKDCQNQLELARLSKRRSAVIAKLGRTDAFARGVDRLAQALIEGQEATIAYLGGQAHDMARVVFAAVVSSEAENELYELGSKIDAIETVIDNNKCKAQKQRLLRSSVEFERLAGEVVVTFGDVALHGARAWSVVEQLGILKTRTGAKFPLFQALQAYNAEINARGRQIVDAVASYQAFLGQAPYAAADQLYAAVNDDLSVVARGHLDSSGEWTGKAEELRHYLATFGEWLHHEQVGSENVLEDIRAGRHLDFVDRVLERVSKEIGFTDLAKVVH